MQQSEFTPTLCSSRRKPETFGDCTKLVDYAGPNGISDCHQLEHFSHVVERFRSEAGMQMIDSFEVHAPAAKGQVSRADQQVGVILREEHRELRMKHASRAGHRLEFIIAPCSASTLLAEPSSDAVRICQDQRVTRTSANQPIEDNRFKERKAKRIGGENCTMPRQGTD
jgi:hypothetical protein